MLHLIYFEPRIPGNTGAAIRLSACTGTLLHLVEPLCFDMDDTKLKRAGLDYHDLAHVKVHPNLEDALAEIPGKIHALPVMRNYTSKRFPTEARTGCSLAPNLPDCPRKSWRILGLLIWCGSRWCRICVL